MSNTNTQEKVTIDDVIISLHDIARHINKYHGLGLIATTVRMCADDLSQIKKEGSQK